MSRQKSKGRATGKKQRSRRQNTRSSTIRYPIPQASAAAWKAVNGNRTILLNPGLIFDRFAPDWGRQSTLKKDGLEAARDAANQRSDGTLLKAWKARWEAAVRTVHAEPFSLKTDWRFIAGLGRKGSLEVGFTFHRYGFPILPGSSVKGIARACALIEIAQKVNPPNLKELGDTLAADGEHDREKYEKWRGDQTEEIQKQADDFRAIFGTTAVAGRAVFFDAIPANKPTLELDIMNPHYPRYYSGEEFPTDWQSPKPVYFLTVAAGQEFLFAVGWRGKDNEDLRRQAETWLKAGLQTLGAGAKTSAGYGYFDGVR